MRVSCIIVSFNNGKLLEAAIQSVLAQTHPVDEIIVADDGSSDGSRVVIEGLSHRHRRIRPVFRERNLGVSANRDLAVRDAVGDFVTTLDGDDYFHPNKVAGEVDALRKSGGLIAFSDVQMLDMLTGRTWVDDLTEYSTLGPSGRVRWLLRQPKSPRFMTIAKKLHSEIGGYQHDLRTWEDWDYMLRLAMTPHRWLHSGTIGVVHRLETQGLSQMEPYQQARQRWSIVRRNYGAIRSHVGLPFLAVAVARMLLVSARWQATTWYWSVGRQLRGPTPGPR